MFHNVQILKLGLYLPAAPASLWYPFRRMGLGVTWQVPEQTQLAPVLEAQMI